MKNIQSFGDTLVSLISEFNAFCEKNFAIGPLPIILFLPFSKVIYAKPLAPVSIAHLFRLSKKLLGLSEIFLTTIPLTMPPLSIFLLNMSSFTSSLLNNLV